MRGILKTLILPAMATSVMAMAPGPMSAVEDFGTAVKRSNTCLMTLASESMPQLSRWVINLSDCSDRISQASQYLSRASEFYSSIRTALTAAQSERSTHANYGDFLPILESKLAEIDRYGTVTVEGADVFASWRGPLFEIRYNLDKNFSPFGSQSYPPMPFYGPGPQIVEQVVTLHTISRQNLGFSDTTEPNIDSTLTSAISMVDVWKAESERQVRMVLSHKETVAQDLAYYKGQLTERLDFIKATASELS